MKQVMDAGRTEWTIVTVAVSALVSGDVQDEQSSYLLV